MNLVPSKKEWDAFDRAYQGTPRGKTARKPAELHLSGTLTQSVPFLNEANQFGAKLVQFTIKPVPVLEPANSVVSKKVLAAMASDPDPAASLADIRKLLVGPTRNLHDAMFEEIITILEESDHEVQQVLRSLKRQGADLSDLVNQLVSLSVRSTDEAHGQADYFRHELQKATAKHQGMLSEMFLVIDSKIQELTKQVGQKVEALAKRIETHRLEASEGHERKLQELEAKCLASSRKAAELIEARLANLERRSSRGDDAMTQVVTDGLANMVERIKLLRDRA